MSKFSVLIALCFFFCVASAQFSDPVVEFDSSLLPIGNISTWENTGSLGGEVISVDEVPVVETCGEGLQGVLFNGEVFFGDLASSITFSASDAAVVIVVASAEADGPIITTGPSSGADSADLLGPGALYAGGAFTQDAEDISANKVNTFTAAVGKTVAVAFVYETPIGTTINDFWITPDDSGTNVYDGASVATSFASVSIGERLLETGFAGCIHYLAIHQVLSTPVNEDALSATLLDLAIKFGAVNATVSASPAPRTTGSSTTGSSTTSTTGSSTTGSRTTGRRATTHVSSATIPAVPSLLFAAIVSFFLFFLW